MARQYTDQERIDALARLELNAGRLKPTAAELGIPHATLRLWRDQMFAENPGTVATLSPPVPEIVDFAGRWAEVMQAAQKRLLELIPQSESVREVAIAAGIAADKHLDYRDGRKGAAVSVINDNRRTVNNLNVITDEKLDRVLAAVDAGTIVIEG